MVSAKLVYGQLSNVDPRLQIGVECDWFAQHVDGDSEWSGVGVVEHLTDSASGFLVARIRPVEKEASATVRRRSQLVSREAELWPFVNQQIIDTTTHQLVFGNDATTFGPTKVANANAAIIVRRGFVDEVRISMVRWCGGQCDWCDGHGYTYDEADGQVMCVACGGENAQMDGEPGRWFPQAPGSGMVVGIGAEVVLSHPIRRVVATDWPPETRGGNWMFPANRFAPLRVRISLCGFGSGDIWFLSQELAITHQSAELIALSKAQIANRAGAVIGESA